MRVCQDFVESDVKNWRGLLIALLVIAAMCGVILLAIVIVTPGILTFSVSFIQEAQLSQTDRATLRIIEYIAKSLKITQGHSK